jgi:UDP-N-acetylmuramoyl-L-alanyl-D-glutamate--2,6-diaminopimelate ligase
MIPSVELNKIFQSPHHNTIAHSNIYSASIDLPQKENDLVFILHPEKVSNQFDLKPAALVIEDPTLLDRWKNYPVFLVPNVRRARALFYKKFFQLETQSYDAIAVTGTNGKTSVCTLLAEALGYFRGKACYVGTRGYERFEGNLGKTLTLDNEVTTPDSFDLYEFLANELTNNVSTFAIEVSSFALDQERISGVDWQAALFLNLTQDHLDYHRNFEDYFNSKALLFRRDLLLSNHKNKFSILNHDSIRAAQLASELKKTSTIPTKSFGANSEADFHWKILAHSRLGMEFEFTSAGQKIICSTKLIGRFNAENLAATALCLSELGYSVREIQEVFPKLSSVPGRLERIDGKGFSAFVDYAHSPDSLEKALLAIRELSPRKIITVFGCGGARDRKKRPIMGEIAERLSDEVLVTSDNPRTEEPTAIIEDILKGMHSKNILSFPDRKEAIQAALKKAEKNDIILIAGKGHESYQEIDGVRHPFSDQEEVRRALNI